MATSLPRLLSSLHCTRSEPLTRSVANSVTRLLCSSSTQSHHENPVKEQAQAQASQESLQDESRRSQEDEDDDDDDVNKKTGEIGGPKGPEPTRYGDWERNGRCYDF